MLPYCDPLSEINKSAAPYRQYMLCRKLSVVCASFLGTAIASGHLLKQSAIMYSLPDFVSVNGPM